MVCGPRVRDYRFRLLLAGVPEEKISYTEKEIDTPEKLLLPENDNVYILYGTDSIGLGRDVANRTEKRMQSMKEGGDC